MTPKIAIHKKDSGGWTDNWIKYCQDRHLAYEVVNCYDSDIIDRLREFDGLLWNINHWSPTDMLMARHILFSAESMGLAVFPDFHTCWHFDDKIAEKYALEAVGAPVVPTHVFYDEDTAMSWLKAREQFPLVGKLRRGAGSYNVKLLRTRRKAMAYCRRMFRKGVSPIPGLFADTQRRIRNLHGWKAYVKKLKTLPRFWNTLKRGRRFMPKEKGYVYLQDFIAGNTYDIRISVIGDRAWGFTRNVRKNDFRASGSGTIDYDLGRIPMECVEAGFKVAGSLKAQSIAFDFVRDSGGKCGIVEISYGFVNSAIYNASGYWDRQMKWHEGHFLPEDAVMDDLIARINAGKQVSAG